MNRRAFALSAVATLSGVVTLAVTRAHAQDSAPGAPRTYRYARTPGAAPDLQSLDLYAASGQIRPLVVFIHGGGWRIGDKTTATAGREKAAFFNARGLAYASLNYRLSPGVTHPAHVEDVAAALAWLADHAADHGLDPHRIYLMGHSAGAHLAALVATDARRLSHYGRTPAMLRGVIVLDGAGYDVTEQAPATMQRGGLLGEMYQAAFGDDPAGWADASPVNFVARGHVTAPFLIVHTDRPDSVRQSTLLADKLRDAGVEARLFRAAGYTHADVNRRIGQPGEPVTGAIIEALHRWGV